MEALAVVATVASIVQLSQAALSLSKTLYDVSSTIASAKEEIQNLADDLKTFSQSLTLLSRLLEDSKAYYSDDVYLLTAKIIRDCADLYGKIDKVLIKLGGNGKTGWKFKVKFAYKESQIKKLMERLRDMKGTLATILMSLQVDLQLSLLNISSASKLQRPPEESLQSKTIQTLEEARQSVQAAEFLPRYTSKAANAILCVETEIGIFDKKTNQTAMPILEKEHSNQEEASNASIKPAKKAQAFDQHLFTMYSVSQASKMEPEPAKLVSEPQPSHNNPKSESAEQEFFPAQSLKSSSSTESFKSFTSAISMQSESETIESQMDKVKSVIHAFRVALETLESLVAKKFPAKKLGEQSKICDAAQELEALLWDGITNVQQRNAYYCERYGFEYIKSFTGSDTAELERISASILKDVVLPLHIHSASHQNISDRTFEDLHSYSKKVIQRTLETLTGVSNSAALEDFSQTRAPKKKRSMKVSPPARDHLEYGYPTKSVNTFGQAPEDSLWANFDSYGGRRKFHRSNSDSLFSPLPFPTQGEIEAEENPLLALQGGSGIGENFYRFAKAREQEDPRCGHTYRPMGSCTNDRCGLIYHQQMAGRSTRVPELTLPFIGYTFKRFEHVPSSTNHDIEMRIKEQRTQYNIQNYSYTASPGNIVSPEQDRIFEPEMKSELPQVVSPVKTLWQISLITLKTWSPEILESLDTNFTHIFGINTEHCELLFAPDGDDNYGSFIGLITDYYRNEPKLKAESDKIREKIFNVMTTIIEQIGLRLGSIPWCCVYVLLNSLPSSNYNNKVTRSESDNEFISTVTQLTHLLEITSIIARYTVMEHLYNTTNTGLDIDPEYQNQMVDLCVAIFTYFDSAITLALPLVEGGVRIQDLARYEKNLERVRKLDDQSRGFKISVAFNQDERGESASESESEEVDEESQNEENDDGNDEDWERIDSASRANSELVLGSRS